MNELKCFLNYCGEPGPQGPAGEDVFIAWVNHTTFQEIVNAYNSGKLIGAVGHNGAGTQHTFLQLTILNQTQAVFHYPNRSSNQLNAAYVVCNSDDTWVNQLITCETTANKATDFNTLNDTKYPTTKAVADYVTSHSGGSLYKHVITFGYHNINADEDVTEKMTIITEDSTAYTIETLCNYYGGKVPITFMMVDNFLEGELICFNLVKRMNIYCPQRSLKENEEGLMMAATFSSGSF